jgi:predicted nucleotidyltransferase
MGNIITKNKIEIQPKGSYFVIDKNGFIINPANIEKIQPEWKPIIDDVIKLYKQTYGKHLKNVYIRGSVAKGEAVKNVSDIDAFAYVDLAKEETEKDTMKELREELERKYDFIDGIEMGVNSVSEIKNDTIILNQSVCVFGDPISVPKMKVGKETAIHSPQFHNRFKWFQNFLQKDDSDEELKKGCVWLMKGLLRVGFELTMERSQRYTRDLYRCYETFAEYYPEKEVEMREVLELALNPTANKNKMKEIMENIGAFLLLEIPKYFEIKQ